MNILIKTLKIYQSQRPLIASILYHRNKRHIFDLKVKWLQWNRLFYSSEPWEPYYHRRASRPSVGTRERDSCEPPLPGSEFRSALSSCCSGLCSCPTFAVISHFLPGLVSIHFPAEIDIIKHLNISRNRYCINTSKNCPYFIILLMINFTIDL